MTIHDQKGEKALISKIRPWPEVWNSLYLWKFMTTSVKQPLFMTARVQKYRTAPIHDSPYSAITYNTNN